MYLVINLTVIDVFIGGVAVYYLFYWPGVYCNLWKRHSIDARADNFINVMLLLFFAASLTNIAIIALERVHATFFPLRHRLLRKWVYRLMITVVWATPGLGTIANILLLQYDKYYYGRCFQFTFISFCLLIIWVSYTSIVVKVRCGAQPRHHGAASRERKLTMTLLIVTVVSFLLYLPHVIFYYIFLLPHSVRYHLGHAFLNLFYANSLVNPILYTLRLPEYRSALFALFRKRPQQQRQVAVFPLLKM